MSVLYRQYFYGISVEKLQFIIKKSYKYAQKILKSVNETHIFQHWVTNNTIRTAEETGGRE